MLPWDPLWRLRHVGYPVSPRGYRGLPAFASLSMAGSEGISEATLYNWRKAAWAEGRLLPDGDSTPAGWSSADKFAAVLETAALNEQELAEYCRERGLYPAQIQQWREACAQANDWECSQNKRLQEARRNDEKRIRKLEKELRHKEKSLAETAALLVLSKKLKAIWGGRGKMTSGPDRKEILELVDEAEQSGARHSRIAELLGLHARTLRRWREAEEEGRADRRPTAERPRPVNALSEEEREAVLELCNQPEYAHLPPSQIAPGWRTRASTWPRNRPSTASSEQQAKPRTGDVPSPTSKAGAPPALPGHRAQPGVK